MGRFVLRTEENCKPFWVWESHVPRILDEVLFSTVYLYRSFEEAKKGTIQGGTGVIISYNAGTPQKFDHCYAVTAAHVVRQGFSVVRAVNKNEDVSVWPFKVSDWHFHPDGDDLAVCPVDLYTAEKGFLVIGYNKHSLTPRNMVGRNVGIGDEIFMVSRLLGYDGNETNKPVLRWGTLALGSPSQIEQQGSGVKQESLLVEMRSISGHSGSPVYVFFPHWAGRVEPNAPKRSQALLLGIDWGHLPHRCPVRDEGGKKIGDVEVPSAMAAVVPAWKIKDILDMKELVEHRRLADERETERRKPLAAVLDAESPEFSQEDFERALKKASRRLEPSQSGEET